MRKIWVVAVVCLAAVMASMSLASAGESGYANVVTVSPTGADFTSVSAAVNSITNASDTNRYVIKVQPGTYFGQVVCKPYVDIVGASRKTVILTHNGAWSDYRQPRTDAATVVASTNADISDLTVLATAPSGVGIMTGGVTGGRDSTLSNLNVEGGWMGVSVGADMDSISYDRESNIDRWVTLRDCNVKCTCTGGTSSVQAAELWDNTAAYNCIFTVNSSGTAADIFGVYIGGNTVLRDCQINVTVTGSSPTQVGGFWNTDVASPTRLERTSISVRMISSSATCEVFGVRDGMVNDYLGATTEIDHCSIKTENRGSGDTYDLINAANDPEGHDTTIVFGTKYDTGKTYGTITIANGN